MDAAAGRLRHARRAAAQVDLPAQQRQLARCHGRRRWYAGSLDRVHAARCRRAGEAARAVAAAGQPRCAGDAVPARRALGRDEQLVSHAPPARDGGVGAGHRLPRLRPQHRRAALRDHRLRGCPRGVGLAAPAAAEAAAADLRPFAGQRDRGSSGRRGRRRGRRGGRRRLHVGARCVRDNAIRLAAVGAADHAALRRRAAHCRGGLTGAGGAWRAGSDDPAGARPRVVRPRPRAQALHPGRNGTHHNAQAMVSDQVRDAMHSLFGLPGEPAAAE